MSYALTTLQVQDLEKSLEFYTGTLGLPLICRFEGKGGVPIAMVGEEKGAHLELIGTGRPAPEQPGNGISIGFYVEDAQALIEELKVRAEGPISPNPALRFFFIQDPDGYRIQLLERLAGN